MAHDAQRFGLDHGAPLKCPVCSNEDFVEGKAQLNTRVMSFLNFDWANPSAYYYTCTRCGHLLWFARKLPGERGRT